MGADPLTIAAIGFKAFSAFQGISNAKSQAKAIAQEGAIAAENKKIETMRKAGAARASFLNSGFDIFGTPESSISGIYDTGQSDIGRIISNANRKSKAAVSGAVGKAFGDIATMAAGASLGGAGGGYESTGFGSANWANTQLGGSYFGSNISGTPWRATTDLGDRMPWLT